MPPTQKKPARSPELKALGKALKKLREDLDLTQEEVGSRAYTDHKLAGDIERGQRDPQYTTLLRLATALETEPETIVRLANRFAELGDSSPGDV